MTAVLTSRFNRSFAVFALVCACACVSASASVRARARAHACTRAHVGQLSARACASVSVRVCACAACLCVRYSRMLLLHPRQPHSAHYMIIKTNRGASGIPKSLLKLIPDMDFDDFADLYTECHTITATQRTTLESCVVAFMQLAEPYSMWRDVKAICRVHRDKIEVLAFMHGLDTFVHSHAEPCSHGTPQVEWMPIDGLEDITMVQRSVLSDSGFNDADSDSDAEAGDLKVAKRMFRLCTLVRKADEAKKAGQGKKILEANQRRKPRMAANAAIDTLLSRHQ